MAPVTNVREHSQIPSFEQRKRTFLGKEDKSSAGGIDAHCVALCEEINRLEAWFTTSSCSGRAFMFRGEGVKSTDDFLRFGVTHELIPDPPERYFDLALLDDPTGAEDAERRIIRAPVRKSHNEGCIEGLRRWAQRASASHAPSLTWLRFEPFILHVCCRDFAAAAVLIAAARTVFKNVGLQGWTEGKLILAIWGDEGLDMPLTTPDGTWLFTGQASWLQELVNSRHVRNWAKIDRFQEAVRNMVTPAPGALFTSGAEEIEGDLDGSSSTRGGKHYDVVGDVVVLQSAPPKEDQVAVGIALLKEVKKASIVAVRRSSLDPQHRAPVELEIIAGPHRSPLITTHTEFGCKYVIDLEAVFFSTKMAAERQRLCNLTRSGERVCVLFAGCGPEALQLARATVSEVCAVELNPVAVQCLRRSISLLHRSAPEAAQKITVLEGDVRTVVPELVAKRSFHRVVAPRPRGHQDDADEGAEFLALLLPLVLDGGEVHWFDFVADWELPDCSRTRARIEASCAAGGVRCEILRCDVANRKTVAERQFRAVVDFRVHRS